MKFYVDSCIYLNLWKKESRNGVLFWKIAEDFFEKASFGIIYYSGFILKELTCALATHEFLVKKEVFSKPGFSRVFPTQIDYELARRLELEANFEISFFDCMHIVLTKKINAVLITRDRKLIEFAKKYCGVCRPEEIL